MKTTKKNEIVQKKTQKCAKTKYNVRQTINQRKKCRKCTNTSQKCRTNTKLHKKKEKNNSKKYKKYINYIKSKPNILKKQRNM